MARQLVLNEAVTKAKQLLDLTWISCQLITPADLIPSSYLLWPCSSMEAGWRESARFVRPRPSSATPVRDIAIAVLQQDSVVFR